MSLIDQVSDELKKAMLAKDAARTTGLRMIRAKFIELQKEGKGEVTDERCIDALRSLRKQREESIVAYEAAGRQDLADPERVELAVIDAFLPKLADEETTLAWVKEAVAASGVTTAKEAGKVMGALMKAHKADVDAGLARKLIEKQLAG